MVTLLDAPEFTANEIYAIQQADPVEGAAASASFSGLGVSNQPHQQLANRTSLLKQRQDVNITNIGVLQAFAAGFTSSLQTNGYMRIPLNDAQRGQVSALIQWGFYSLPQLKVGVDAQYSLVWPVAFPNAILVAPFATNNYLKTGGMNLVVSSVSYSVSGATFVLDVPGALLGTNSAVAETTNGFSWLAIGF
jgi:hypothetical protein